MPEPAKVATPIIRHQVGDFLKVGGTFAPMTKFTEINESPNAVTNKTFYTADKSATTDTVGYDTVFPFSGIAHKNDPVTEFIRNIYQEQKTGADCETDYVRVDYTRPDSSAENTYYARQFHVAIEVTSESGAGGEKVAIAGNMNGMGNVKVGKFDTSAGTFTEGAIQEAATV